MTIKKEPTYTVCSGCGRKFLLSDLKGVTEEISRDNPGISINSTRSRLRFVKVRYQHVKLCDRCAKFKKVSKVITAVSTIVYFVLLCMLTYKGGEGLWWLYGLLWFTLSPFLFGKLTGMLFEVIVKSDTIITGDKRYHKEGRFGKCDRCNGTGLYLYDTCSRCKGQGFYTEHFW